jgi:hypothetical protein
VEKVLGDDKYVILYNDGDKETGVARNLIVAMHRQPPGEQGNVPKKAAVNEPAKKAAATEKLSELCDFHVNKDEEFSKAAGRLLGVVFKHFDKDGDGAWDLSEWQAMQQSVGEELIDMESLSALYEHLEIEPTANGGTRLEDALRVFAMSVADEETQDEVKKKMEMWRALGVIDWIDDTEEKKKKAAAVEVARKEAAAATAAAAAADTKGLSVGEKVEVRHGGGAEYFPGTVMAALDDGKYDIAFSDGDRESNIARDMIVRSDRALEVGAKVQARHGGGPEFFPAKVGKVNADRTYELRYEDGDSEPNVARHRIRRPGDKQHKHLEVGDVCDVRHGGGEQLFPGKIARVGQDGDRGRMYDVVYDDGDKESNVPRKFIFAQCMTPCPTTPAVKCKGKKCRDMTHNADGYCQNHRMAATEALRKAAKQANGHTEQDSTQANGHTEQDSTQAQQEKAHQEAQAQLQLEAQAQAHAEQEAQAQTQAQQVDQTKAENEEQQQQQQQQRYEKEDEAQRGQAARLIQARARGRDARKHQHGKQIGKENNALQQVQIEALSVHHQNALQQVQQVDMTPRRHNGSNRDDFLGQMQTPLSPVPLMATTNNIPQQNQQSNANLHNMKHMPYDGANLSVNVNAPFMNHSVAAYNQSVANTPAYNQSVANTPGFTSATTPGFQASTFISGYGRPAESLITDLRLGLKIEARPMGRSRFKSGTIVGQSAKAAPYTDTCLYTVLFENGKHEQGLRRLQLRRPGEKQPRRLKLGVEVDARRGGKQGQLAPAQIVSVNADNTYSIKFEDGTGEDFVERSVLFGQCQPVVSVAATPPPMVGGAHFNDDAMRSRFEASMQQHGQPATRPPEMAQRQKEQHQNVQQQQQTHTEADDRQKGGASAGGVKVWWGAEVCDRRTGEWVEGHAVLCQQFGNSLAASAALRGQSPAAKLPNAEVVLLTICFDDCRMGLSGQYQHAVGRVRLLDCPSEKNALESQDLFAAVMRKQAKEQREQKLMHAHRQERTRRQMGGAASTTMDDELETPSWEYAESGVGLLSDGTLMDGSGKVFSSSMSSPSGSYPSNPTLLASGSSFNGTMGTGSLRSPGLSVETGRGSEGDTHGLVSVSSTTSASGAWLALQATSLLHALVLVIIVVYAKKHDLADRLPSSLRDAGYFGVEGAALLAILIAVATKRTVTLGVALLLVFASSATRLAFLFGGDADGSADSSGDDDMDLAVYCVDAAVFPLVEMVLILYTLQQHEDPPQKRGHSKVLPGKTPKGGLAKTPKPSKKAKAGNKTPKVAPVPSKETAEQKVQRFKEEARKKAAETTSESLGDERDSAAAMQHELSKMSDPANTVAPASAGKSLGADGKVSAATVADAATVSGATEAGVPEKEGGGNTGTVAGVKTVDNQQLAATAPPAFSTPRDEETGE